MGGSAGPPSRLPQLTVVPRRDGSEPRSLTATIARPAKGLLARFIKELDRVPGGGTTPVAGQGCGEPQGIIGSEAQKEMGGGASSGMKATSRRSAPRRAVAGRLAFTAGAFITLPVQAVSRFPSPERGEGVQPGAQAPGRRAVRDRRAIPGAYAPGFTPPPLAGLGQTNSLESERTLLRGRTERCAGKPRWRCARGVEWRNQSENVTLQDSELANMINARPTSDSQRLLQSQPGMKAAPLIR
jgi:hypothetical protein